MNPVWTYNIEWNSDVPAKKIRAEMKSRLLTAANALKTQIQQNLKIPGRGNPGSPGDYPRAIRGNLAKSIFASLVSDTMAMVGVDAETPAKKYAQRLETGGTITSHGKLMAVPISEALKQHSMGGKGPRTFEKPLVRIKRPGKTMLLVQIPARGNRRAWIIHYILTPSVTIAARPYLERTFTQMIPRIMEIFREPLPV